MISTPIYIAPIARGVGHLTATVTADQTLTDPRLGVAVYIDMGAVANTNLGLPIFYLDAHIDLGHGGVAWISIAWRDQIDGHDPADTLALLTQPAHSEAVVLGETAEERALAWRDFRSYSAARDAALDDPPECAHDRFDPHMARFRDKLLTRLGTPALVG